VNPQTGHNKLPLRDFLEKQLSYGGINDMKIADQDS
jgi:hypothetical protein